MAEVMIERVYDDQESLNREVCDCLHKDVIVSSVEQTSKSMAYQTSSVVTEQASTIVEEHVSPRVVDNTPIQT